MTDWLAFPPARRVRGAIAVPGSKSGSNRALAIAAVSRTPVRIAGLLESEDTRAMIRCLSAMGASLDRVGDSMEVRGPLGAPSTDWTDLDAGESGTAARFVAALASTAPGRFRLVGSRRLSQRPMDELVRALRSGGAHLESEGHDGLPLRIEGATLRSGRVAVDASRSSQFFSALLIAGAALEGGLEVETGGAVASAPYVAMTLATLRAFGHRVSEEDARVRVAPGDRAPSTYVVPGDYSSAVPLLAACGIAGGELEISRVAVPSADPDAAALPVLERMGVGIRRGPAGVRAEAAAGTLRAVRVRATDFPDSVPPLAALAAFAPGESRFEGIGHLREKESDRIEALAALLGAAGVEARAEPDALSVIGSASRLPAAVRRLPTFGDHRIAMAAALLALRVPGCLIEQPGCVAKSYPAFFQDLETIVVR